MSITIAGMFVYATSPTPVMSSLIKFNASLFETYLLLVQNLQYDCLINRSLTTYNKKGQKEPATWIYEKYGNLVKHVLLHLKLDSTSILRDMTNYIMTLEEAIRHDVFKRGVDVKENALDRHK